MATTEKFHLGDLVDLALGTPEVGTVNFKILHTVLRSIIENLNLGHVTAQLSDAERSLYAAHAVHPGPKSTEDPTNSSEPKSEQDKPAPQRPKTARTAFHALEDRVRGIEKELTFLKDLPSNQDLMREIQTPDPDSTGTQKDSSPSTEAPKEHHESNKPVQDMYKLYKAEKLIDVHDDLIEKLTQMVDELGADHKNLLSKMKKMEESLAKKEDKKEKQPEVNLKPIEDDIENLKEAQNAIKSNLEDFITEDDIQGLVTWQMLEDRLKGIRDSVQQIHDSQAQLLSAPKKEQRDSAVQARIGSGRSTRGPGTPDNERDGESRPVSRASRPKSAIFAPPSSELTQLLENLGSLNDRHNALVAEVQALREEINRLNEENGKPKQEVKGVDQDLLNRLNAMEAQMRSLQEEVQRSADDMAPVRKSLVRLQEEMNKLRSKVEELDQDSSRRDSTVDKLNRQVEDMEGRKVDRSVLDSLLQTKADVTAVDSKVDRKLFDDTTMEMNKELNDLLARINEMEQELQRSIARLSEDMLSKVGKEELLKMKDQIQRLIQSLTSKIDKIPWDMLNLNTEDEAAGMRKRFNCLSCDRPLDVLMPQTPTPSIPNREGLPAMKSLRPHTVYMLDSLRQHQRGLTDVSDIYQVNRGAGGSHTAMSAYRRPQRAGHLSSASIQEYDYVAPSPPSKSEELHLLGQDGHMYKGRGSKEPTKIPALPVHGYRNGQAKSRPSTAKAAVSVDPADNSTHY